jgi:hypothetical protein
MKLDEANQVLAEIVEALVRPPQPATTVGTQAQDANDVDMWGLDYHQRKRLKVKNIHSKRGIRRPRIPHRTNLPFNLAYIE